MFVAVYKVNDVDKPEMRIKISREFVKYLGRNAKVFVCGNIFIAVWSSTESAVFVVLAQ